MSAIYLRELECVSLCICDYVALIVIIFLNFSYGLTIITVLLAYLKRAENLRVSAGVPV